MKPQAPSFLLKVRLPSFILVKLGKSAAGETNTDCAVPFHIGLGETGRKRPVRIPEETLLEGAYVSCMRDVVTVTVPAAASCNTAVQCILEAADFSYRPASDYQLLQCFADFSADYTRPAMTGDSHGQPIKFVMQFPFHLALILSPFVRRREHLRDEIEPVARRSIAEERRNFSLYAQQYQQLLKKIHDQYSFLRGRESEARRQKKIDESIQRFELTRYRILRDERNGRMWMRSSANDELSALRIWFTAEMEKRWMMERTSPLWILQENEANAIYAFFRRQAQQMAMRNVLFGRFASFETLAHSAAQRVLQAKRFVYTKCRIAANVGEAISHGVDSESAHIERIRAGQSMFPLVFEQPDITNVRTITHDAYCNTRCL